MNWADPEGELPFLVIPLIAALIVGTGGIAYAPKPNEDMVAAEIRGKQARADVFTELISFAIPAGKTVKPVKGLIQNCAKQSTKATKKKETREGVYRFFDRLITKWYHGQSGDLERRRKEHIRDQRLEPEDNFFETFVPGGRKARVKVEQGNIDKDGGIENLANKRNAIRKPSIKKRP